VSVPTVGELFAGIGGFGLGFRRAGFDHAFLVEWDGKCQEVLARQFPGVPLFADVRDVGAHNLPPCDVLTFGSPCQDLSVAGKRAGFEGERSGLFFEAIRVIRELRERDGKPAIAIWENVPGAFSSNRGRDFAAALDALAECGALDIAWRVLDAQHFGLAQRRRRVFVVADFGGERAGEVLFEPDGLRRDSAAGGAEGEGAAGPVTSGARGGGLAGAIGSGGGRGDGNDPIVIVPATANPLVASGRASARVGDSRGQDTVVAFTFDPAQITSPGNRSAVGGEVAHTLASGGYPPALASVSPAVTAKWAKGSGGPAGDESANLVPAYVPETAGTIAGGAHPGGLNGQEAPTQSIALCGESSWHVRRLTPVECARLQGFPDDWNEWLADSHRYRQFGNAVAVPVAEWLARRVALALGGGRRAVYANPVANTLVRDGIADGAWRDGASDNLVVEVGP